MEDDIVLDERVFELPFAEEQVPAVGILCLETATIIVCFSNVKVLPVHSGNLSDIFRYE